MEIVRGAKRKLLAVTIEADGKNEYLNFTIPELRTASKKEIIQSLAESGLWAAIKQRPYGTIANPEANPKSIFITGFDSAPLAPDLDFALKGEIESIQMGIKV